MSYKEEYEKKVNNKTVELKEWYAKGYEDGRDCSELLNNAEKLISENKERIREEMYDLALESIGGDYIKEMGITPTTFKSMNNMCFCLSTMLNAKDLKIKQLQDQLSEAGIEESDTLSGWDSSIPWVYDSYEDEINNRFQKLHMDKIKFSDNTTTVFSMLDEICYLKNELSAYKSLKETT